MLKGVDIGGTFIKVLWEDGRKEKHYIGDIKSDKEKLLKKIKEVVLEGKPDGAGISVAGFTSLEGKVFRSPNIPVLDGVDMGELFKDTGIDYIVGNDVTLGAFGEWFYDHKDSKVLVFIAVGTGLGSGLVIEGKPFFGVCGSALELGHHIIEKDGELCNCGRRGCLEAYCSSYGLRRIYRKLGGKDISDREIIERALKGEDKALKALEIFEEYLSIGIMNALHIFNPDIVVLGGGVIEGMKPFLINLEEIVKEKAENLPSECFKLEFSKAGEFASARGALAMILSKNRY